MQANIVAAGYGTGHGGGDRGPLHAVGAGKCLDDPNSSTTPGTQTQIWLHHGRPTRPGPTPQQAP